MQQGEIVITYRVDSSGALTAISNIQKKMYESERALNSTQSKYGKFFDGLNQGFGGVANTIKKFGIVAAGVYRPRQWLANNTSADGFAHWVNRGGQQGFWSTV